LWPALAGSSTSGDRARFRRPAILRFSTDSFMEEFMTLLNNEPQRLAEWRAKHETWRSPTPTPEPIEALPAFARSLNRLRLAQALPATTPTAAIATTAIATTGEAADDEPLTLYQPAHQRHYLVTACLVCRVPGLPDRLLDTGDDERVSFVLRRLRPKAPGPLPARFDLETCDEYAFAGTPQNQQWRKVGNGATLLPDEEPMPLFGATYVESDGRRRRLMAGVIPVGKREAYMAAPAAALDPANTAPPPDPRHAQLLSQVTDPWRSLLGLKARSTQLVMASRTAMFAEGLSVAEVNQRGYGLVAINAGDTVEQRAAAAQIQQLSWYLLLDFADYLDKYLSNVWAVIANAAPATGLSAAETALLNALNAANSHGKTLSAALKEIIGQRDALEATTAPYPPAPTRPILPGLPSCSRWQMWARWSIPPQGIPGLRRW